MAKKRSRVDRLQNLAIVLLTLSALTLLASMPLFGALSDQSLIDLAGGWLKRDKSPVRSESVELTALSAPVRLMLSNAYTRLGLDALTTQDDAFNPAGSYLGEAIGSASMAEEATQEDFLAALGGTGIYFDFTAPLPLDALALTLGITAPELPLSDVHRALLCPGEYDSLTLYLQDSAERFYRCDTALGSAELLSYLSALDGNGAEFALFAGRDYEALSPYTMVLSNLPARCTLDAGTPFSVLDSADFLRLAEFNAHTENRYVESSGTVIVRETSSTLHLNPNGTVSYQGSNAKEGSIYAVSSALPGEPTLSESVSAAQKLVLTLLQHQIGDAEIYLAGVSQDEGSCEISFDYMYGGTPIRFADGNHAAVVTVKGTSITAFTLHLRHYTAGASDALVLPLRQAAAIARSDPGTELTIVYVDSAGDRVEPCWVMD